MKIQSKGFALPLQKQLINILEKEIVQENITSTVVLNFRDPEYSAESGGFHPVEIMISEEGIIAYITDFSYVGDGYFSELAKEIDFDFAAGILEHFGHCYPIEQAWELFQIWQQNFCAYYEMGVFSVEVTVYD